MEDFEGLPSKQNSSSEEAEFQTPRCTHFHRRKKGTFPHTLSFLVSLQIGRKTEAGLLQGVPIYPWASFLFSGKQINEQLHPWSPQNFSGFIHTSTNENFCSTKRDKVIQELGLTLLKIRWYCSSQQNKRKTSKIKKLECCEDWKSINEQQQNRSS